MFFVGRSAANKDEVVIDEVENAGAVDDVRATAIPTCIATRSGCFSSSSFFFAEVLSSTVATHKKTYHAMQMMFLVGLEVRAPSHCFGPCVHQ